MAASTARTAVAYGALYLIPSRSAIAISYWGLSSFSQSKRMSLSCIQRSVVVRAARTESGGVSVGHWPPNCELPEPLTGNLWKLDDFELYPCLLVMFICNHCSFVIHLNKDIVKLSNFYVKKGLAVVSISSNFPGSQLFQYLQIFQDGPELMAEDAKKSKYPFPYLYDEDGRRPCELVYHGQFDDSRPSDNIPVTGRDISLAIDLVPSCQPNTNTIKSKAKCWLQHKVAFRNRILS